MSIAKEMQAARDRNIMDAWQHGGEFEGNKATDELVLDYWKERLKGVSQKDPLYDTYKNAVGQYEYAIAESKMSTKYAQGKIGDGAMAHFYLNWALKVPKNSEFYRVLQRDAAQFMRSARAKGAAGAAKAKEQAYQDAQKTTEAKYEKAGQYLTDVFRSMAQASALIEPGNTGRASDLQSFDPSDPAAMVYLISRINGSDGQHGPETAFLYHDPLTGQAVTGADVIAKLKALDPHFTGQVSVSYFGSTLRNQLTGEAERLKRAQDTGHKTDANNLVKWQDYTSEIGREANAWPIEQAYMDARQQFLQTWLNPAATPDSKLSAWQAYSGKLTSLANDSSRMPDDNTRARLLAEVQGNDKVSSLAEDFTGLNSVDHTTTGMSGKGDIAETHYDVERFIAMQDEVASGEAIWAQGETKNGVFMPSPGGKEIGAATPSDVQAASPAAAVPIVVPQDGANPITVWAPGIPITAVARNADGQALSSFAQDGGNSANAQVGTAYDVTINGQTSRIFEYKATDGHTYYTHDAPWGDKVVAHDVPSGIQLDLSAYVPAASAVDGSQGAAFSLDPSSGKLVYNPTSLVYGSDPARALAGPDPNTDFFSPTIAAILGTPDGINELYQLGKDPAFRQLLDREAHEAAGAQLDPTTGAWAGGDQAAFDKFTQQGNLWTSVPELPGKIGEAINAGISLFGRDSTQPTFKPLPPAIGYGDRAIGSGAAPSDVLPSEQVRATPFSALGDVFQGGKNLFKSLFEDGGALTIKTGSQITVPQAPNIGTPSVAPPTIRDHQPTAETVTTTTPPSVTTSAPPSSAYSSPVPYRGAVRPY